MSASLRELAGHRVFFASDGSDIADADGARDLIAEAMGERAAVVVVPVGRLDASFFELRSGLAGEVLQKMVNYRMKFAVVGDVAEHVAASDAFRDLVVESKRSTSYFFAPDMDALTEWLAALPAPR